MEVFSRLVDHIKRSLSKSQKNYQELITLANQVPYLLLFVKDLSETDRDTLYELIKTLHPVTTGRNDHQNEYSEGWECNTCDYKIARELVMRFDNSIEFLLCTARNWYYYDTILCYKAVQSIIAKDPIKGLVEACHNVPYNHHTAIMESIKTEEEMRMMYWEKLKKLNPTYEQIWELTDSTLPGAFLKDVASHILVNKLLKGHIDEKRLTLVFEQYFRQLN